MTVGLLFTAFFILCIIGAVLPLMMPRRSIPLAIGFIGSVAALLLLVLSGLLLIGQTPLQFELWPVLSLGIMQLRTDRLSAVLLFISALVFLPVSMFSATYLRKYIGHYGLRYFSVLYHALLASIVLVLIAGDIVSFLASWEAMSIASYLLVNFEIEREEASHAGFVMLAMSEAGTIAVALALLLVAANAGTMQFEAIRSNPPALSDTMGWAIFLLFFFGFAVKAGLVPLNSWLPLAHPVAPTNVSALLSAVIVNLGIYGVLRFNVDLLPIVGPGPGVVVLIVGSISALVGILYATVQDEMKRLLAHSTIENMGIVAAGVGAAMIFLTSGHHAAAAIALTAALYHLGNHSVYKALLFLGTGAVEAGTGTRELDRLGGIARRMPWTSALFLIGVLAISALPPLNGFVSEWLTLQTVLRSSLLASAPIKIAFAIAGALLALTAGLAVTCFVKVFAMGFLGLPRSEGAAKATEPSRGIRAPLTVLAATCILLGILPTYVIPALDRAVLPLAKESATTALVPPFFIPEIQRQEKLTPKFLSEFHDLGAQIGQNVLPGRGLVVLHRGEEHNPVVFAMSTAYMLAVFAFILTLTFVVFQLTTRARSLLRAPAWDGGLRHLWPQITYTATSFSNPVRVIFDAVLRPTASEETVEAVATHFRTAISRNHAEVHIVDRFVLNPPVTGLRRIAAIVRRMHVGHVNAYAAYVLIALLLVLIVGAGAF
jgi:hydrogenase-4 component B